MRKSKKSSRFSRIAAFCAGILILSVVTACSSAASDVDYDSFLKENGEFLFLSDGTAQSKTVREIPALFDPDDHYETKIWEYSTVDLDGDGKQEAILQVYGVAGDAGGQIILHQDGEKIYGYRTDPRTLIEIKTDGTGTYSDPTGMSEVGICRVSEFSDTGYTLDKISYATGDYMGFDTFVVEHESATEKEFSAAQNAQSEKEDVTWVAWEDEA